MPRPPRERRRSPRHLCSQLVELQGAASGTVLMEDLSPEGAALAVEQQVEAGALIEVIAGNFRARARVRYCVARESDFRLGIEFLDEVRWQRDQWEPEHIFLPPETD